MLFEAIHDAAVNVIPPDGQGERVAASVGVGVCVEEGLSFLAWAGFRERPANPPLEYYFHVSGYRENKVIHYWDRRDLPPYLDCWDRRHIMDGVCRATAELLRVAAPPSLYRATDHIYLPGSLGLAKHERVSLVFFTCGYVIEETGCDSVGRTQWVMTKSP